MSKEINRAVAALFPQNGEPVADIKFFKGTRSNVRAEEFATELLRADAQIKNGTAVRSETLDRELTD